MKATTMIRRGTAIAAMTALAGCATWGDMDRTQRGTAAGAAGGALVGGLVGGPIGAAIGAGAGGYVGHHETRDGGMVTAGAHGTASGPNDAAFVSSVQQSLNERGYAAGAVDGVWGPNTERALMDFQRARGLRETGTLDPQTLSALGVSEASDATAGSAQAAPR